MSTFKVSFCLMIVLLIQCQSLLGAQSDSVLPLCGSKALETLANESPVDFLKTPFSVARLFPKDYATAQRKWGLINKWERFLFREDRWVEVKEHIVKLGTKVTDQTFDEVTETISYYLTKNESDREELVYVMRSLGLEVFGKILTYSEMKNDSNKDDLKKEIITDLEHLEQIELKITQHPVFINNILDLEYDIIPDKKKSLQAVLYPKTKGIDKIHLTFNSLSFNFASEYASKIVFRENVVSPKDELKEKISYLSYENNLTVFSNLVTLILLTHIPDGIHHNLPQDHVKYSSEIQSALNKLSHKDLIFVRNKIYTAFSVKAKESALDLTSKAFQLYLEKIKYELAIVEQKKISFFNKKRHSLIKNPERYFIINPDYLIEEVVLKTETQNSATNQTKTQKIPYLPIVAGSAPFQFSEERVKNTQPFDYLIFFHKEYSAILKEVRDFFAEQDLARSNDFLKSEKKEEILSHLNPLISEPLKRADYLAESLGNLIHENELFSAKISQDIAIETERFINQSLASSDQNTLQIGEKNERLKEILIQNNSLNVYLHEVRKMVLDYQLVLRNRLTVLLIEPPSLLKEEMSPGLLSLIEEMQKPRVVP